MRHALPWAAALTLGLLGLGPAGCTSGKPALEPESQAFISTARLIMTGAEKEIFNHLPDAASRQEFIADFWARRNPDPSAETNEFQQEFERRVEYANTHFREGHHGIDTDRGRIYLYLGSPDRVENFPFNQQESIRAAPDAIRGPMLWWVYYRWELGIAFADKRNDGVYRIIQIEGNLMEAIDQAKLGATAPATGGRPLTFDLKYDSARRVLVLTIPVKKVDFKSEGGRLTTKFTFDLYVYRPGRTKDRLTEDREFSGTPEEVQAREALVFEFKYDLPPGKSYVDVIVSQEGTMTKSRQIFPVKS
jgi:GWxTD domain-containing protein